MTDGQQGVPGVPRQLIVVATEGVATEDTEAVVRAHAGADVEVQVHVIAPASKISWLNWLTYVEGPAGGEAAQRAEPVAASMPADADPHVGDVDPLQAVEDALRLYAADELFIITAPDDDTNWIESHLKTRVRERFGLPITHLVAGSHKES
jgi:hypothetical protein